MVTQSDYDGITPAQYHHALDILWAAVPQYKGPQKERVFELVAQEIADLRCQLAQSREREAALLESAAVEDAYCLAEGHGHKNRVEEALCSLRFQRDTEKARADKLQEKLDRLYDSGLDGPQLIDDSQAFGDRVDEFRQDQSQPLTLIEQRELAQWWAERGTLVSDLDDRCCTEMARAEKAEADLKTNADLLAHQTDLAREAEIGKAKAERLQRLREAAWPVADQVAEPVVVGADGSQCRPVPEGLLRTLREALAAKPKAPSGAEREAPNDDA